jgi:4'-phosphopantetheinyl transferase
VIGVSDAPQLNLGRDRAVGSVKELIGALGENEVHIWSVALEVGAEELAELERLLSADECERADRFHFAEHHRRYIVARSHLRLLLGRYLSRAPQALEFSYGAHGKPSLLTPSSDICFNLSHSHELALYAIGSGRALGVDVERVRDNVAAMDLAERFFATDEVEALKKLPAEYRRRSFFDCWTRKEAYLKACGDGISIELDTFSVSLEPGKRAALRRGPQIERWQLAALEPATGYAAAVCVEGTGWCLRLFSWPA